MKAKILILGIFCLLVFSGLGNALEGSYMYVSLSYGRGWWGWACVTEEGMSGVYGSPMNFCDARECPFEETAMAGYTCNKEGYFWPPAWGLVSRISIPEDLKLVTKEDNYVIDDEICVGEKFEFKKGANKGEWFQDGGHEDSPPVHWVEDVEKVALNMLNYHESLQNEDAENLCTGLDYPDGTIDRTFGYEVPLYTIPVTLHYGGKTAYLQGNFICSLKEKESDTSSLINKKENYYEATSLGDAKFNTNFDVECFYYWFSGKGGWMRSSTDACERWESETGYDIDCSNTYGCENAMFLVPTVIQAGPHATYRDWGTHNVKYNSISDFFKVGTIGINRSIKVVEPAEPSLELSLGMTEKALAAGEKVTIKVKVENAGNTEIKILDVSSNVDYRFITCDKEELKEGEEAECLLEVTPEPEGNFEVTIDYEYSNCGRRKEGSVSESLFESISVETKETTQVYQMNVKGDCENEYYACDSPHKKGKFYAGYECFNREPYFVATKERFNLEFDLSSLPSDAEILSAKLYLHVDKVNEGQEVKIFSTSGAWSPKSCEPGGDICLKPYCKECSPSFDLSGSLVGSKDISHEGWHFIDVKESVKGKKKISLQVRGEKEDKVWAELGEDSCSREEEWDHYDVVFSGEEPYLRIVYK